MQQTFRFLALAFAMTAALCATTAQAFTLSNSNGGDGYVVTTPTSFDLFGADNQIGSSITTYLTTTATGGVYNFDWTYTSHDCCGSYYDPAGAMLNGTTFQLSSAGTTAGVIESGSVTFFLNPGDTFGFYVSSTDTCCGRGEILVTGDVGAAPEPATWSLMILGIGGMGAALRTRRRKVAA